MNSDNEQGRLFERLLTDFLEGELDENAATQLRDLLEGNEELLRSAVNMYQFHRLLGLLASDQRGGSDRFVRGTLERIAKEREGFSAETMRRIRQNAPSSTASPRVSPEASQRLSPEVRLRGPQEASRSRRPKDKRAVAALVVGCWVAAVAVVVAISNWTSVSPNTMVAVPEEQPAGASPIAPPRFSRLAGARFFGELSPAMDSPMGMGKSYILSSGMVELAFPRGAVAIVEGPAVFRAATDECLQLDLGRCSVHAPDGAEGFRVETPDTKIVDRGTRFAVDVSEFNSTDVQVIEGAADLFRQDALIEKIDLKDRDGHHGVIQGPHAGLSKTQEIRLTQEQAVRVSDSKAFLSEPLKFNPQSYRRQLPDRVLSYSASRAKLDGRAEYLQSVTVQRGGKEITYAAEDLIPVELVWFRADFKQGRADHILGGPQLGSNRLAGVSDRSLVTGVINPGGSSQPLKTNPVLTRDPQSGTEGTQGMAVRFARPVINGPGPDIVLFEIHPVPSTTDGDAFRVSPLEMQPGRRSHLVRQYDLSLYSPAALPVTRMYVHDAEKRRMKSLQDLLTTDFVARAVRLDYRALAVGIDLSDLGFKPGEEVDGLFLQDAADDLDFVDPVLIGGLPPPAVENHNRQ